MTGSVAARRYARALFDLAKRAEPGALEKSGTDLHAIASLTRESGALAHLFRDPVFAAEEKKKVLAALADRLDTDAMVRDFLFLLADKHRLALLDTIAGEYQVLLDAEQGILRGEIVSAVPLGDKTRAKVLDTLAQKAGRSLVLNFKVDATLLGGMLLKVGDNIMDASLKTQLSLLRDTIKRGV